MADMMEKDPEKRIRTAAEVAARLEPWAREAAPLPSQQLTKSPWMPPPLPTDADEDQLQDTDASSDVYDNGDSRQGSGSQISQPTYPLIAGGQDTRRIRRVAPPPLPLQRSPSPSTTASVLIALAIAIPISMLVGSLLTFLLLATLG